MFCTKCGKEVTEGVVCSCQQVQQTSQQVPPQEPQSESQQVPPQAQQSQQAWQPPSAATPTDNRKLFCILSYVGVLWLFGLLMAPEKNDPRVRFNVGQGILLTIVSVAINIVVWILQAIVGAIFRTQTWYGVSVISGVGIAINWIIGLAGFGAIIALAVMSIVNVCKGKETYLPIIGKYAFYK